MGAKPRRMLLLKDPGSLSQEESWLRSAYSNIVSNLIELALVDTSTFDPFSSRFMGIELNEKAKQEYRSLMEVTSYFWASKGGRGTLLEKVIASAGGSSATIGLPLSALPEWIAKTKGISDTKEWRPTGSTPKLKFDLTNVLGNRLLFLEIKNRVDSGGTAAREEALAKKFLALSKLIQDEHPVFVGDGNEMDFAQTLLALGITKLEMHCGFLFNTEGSEATIDSDRTRGFFAQSRRLLSDYYQRNNHRFSVKLTYDEANQKLSFQKDGLAVQVDLLYGSEVTVNFTPDKSDLRKVLEKVFARGWDDVWISMTVATSQRSLLLKHGTNYVKEIIRLESNGNSPEFKANFKRFLSDPDDLASLDECIKVLKKQKSVEQIPFQSSAEADTLDDSLASCIYAYCGYKKVKSS